MNDGTFQRVQHSENRLYGPEKLLLCGFPVAAQSKISAVLKAAGLENLAVVWANENDGGQTLAALLDLPGGSGADQDSSLPRAIIVSGITENQLHHLMTTCRQAGMRQALWATLTPTSESWPLSQLLAELQAERDAMAKRTRQ